MQWDTQTFWDSQAQDNSLGPWFSPATLKNWLGVSHRAIFSLFSFGPKHKQNRMAHKYKLDQSEWNGEWNTSMQSRESILILPQGNQQRWMKNRVPAPGKIKEGRRDLCLTKSICDEGRRGCVLNMANLIHHSTGAPLKSCEVLSWITMKGDEGLEMAREEDEKVCTEEQEVEYRMLELRLYSVWVNHSRTMQLKGGIEGAGVVVMIDSGVNRNFVQKNGSINWFGNGWECAFWGISGRWMSCSLSKGV